MQGTEWTNHPKWINWKEGSNNGISDIEYSYKDYKINNSGYRQELIWSGLNISNMATVSNYNDKAEPQSIKIDEGDPVTGLEFEEEIDHEATI
ncbi:5534_t:CDS:2 [Gigaspora rosea]|nr:5534_t:CDS:2 [Gigaspora rosea]